MNTAVSESYKSSEYSRSIVTHKHIGQGVESNGALYQLLFFQYLLVQSNLLFNLLFWLILDSFPTICFQVIKWYTVLAINKRALDLCSCHAFLNYWLHTIIITTYSLGTHRYEHATHRHTPCTCLWELLDLRIPLIINNAGYLNILWNFTAALSLLKSMRKSLWYQGFKQFGATTASSSIAHLFKVRFIGLVFVQMHYRLNV